MPLNLKSMGFLLQFFESFRGKINKKYSTGNEEWIKSETATITSDYLEHFISSLLDNKNASRKNEQYFYFSLTLKDREIFSKQLF